MKVQAQHIQEIRRNYYTDGGRVGGGGLQRSDQQVCCTIAPTARPDLSGGDGVSRV